MRTEDIPTYRLAIESDGVSIRKRISEETLRRIMNVVFLSEAEDAERQAEERTRMDDVTSRRVHDGW